MFAKVSVGFHLSVAPSTSKLINLLCSDTGEIYIYFTVTFLRRTKGLEIPTGLSNSVTLTRVSE
jgi:hypothetical protein